MKIIVQNRKLKCDMGKCANLAAYSLVPDDAPVENYVHLCECCAQEVYGGLQRLFDKTCGRKEGNR